MLVVDHYSRRIVGTAVFLHEPSAREIARFFGRVCRHIGHAPKHLVTDHGVHFVADAFRRWCRRLGVRQRFGAIGKYGLVAPGSTHARLVKPILPMRIAEAVGRSQSPEEGLAALETVAVYVNGPSDWTWPELARTRASLLSLAGAPAPDVEALLRRALDRAGEMGALTFELRTATTLAELLSDEGRGGEALAILAGIMERMPEGRDAPDHRRAAALSEALRQAHSLI